MKPIAFHPDAAMELEAAADFYEKQSSGLGVDFRKDLELAVRRIQAAPLRYSPYSKRTRRFLIRRFPYLVIFREFSDEIMIVAVAHCSRRPGYWHERI